MQRVDNFSQAERDNEAHHRIALLLRRPSLSPYTSSAAASHSSATEIFMPQKGGVNTTAIDSTKPGTFCSAKKCSLNSRARNFANPIILFCDDDPVEPEATTYNDPTTNDSFSHSISHNGLQTNCQHPVRRWHVQRRDSPFAKGQQSRIYTCRSFILHPTPTNAAWHQRWRWSQAGNGRLFTDLCRSSPPQSDQISSRPSTPEWPRTSVNHTP